MLNRLRKGVKSLTAKLLVGLLVVSFAVWGIGDIFSFRLDARVAQVGETEVSAQRFADSLSQQQARLSRRAGELVSFDQMRQSGVASSVLNGLIRDAAFAEEMNRFGLSTPDEAVARAIRDHEAFQGPGGSFSRQMYEFTLQQQGMTASEFESLMRTLLGQELLVEAVEAAAPPPPGVAERIATYRGEQRSVNLLRLTADLAPEPGDPGPGQLRTFHDEHQDMFTEPERRWGEYLHVDAERLLAEHSPDEATVRAAYDEDRDHYTVAERRVVDQITLPDREAAEAAVSRLLSGDATFEALAEERGQSGEDIALGEVTRGDLPGAAASLVFDAADPGIIGPVELPAGYAVYRVREIRPGGAAPFEEVRDEIAERMARDALLTRAPEIANRIEELRAAGNTMREIAEETDARHGTFDGLAQNGTLADGSEAEGLPARDAFIREVFSALDNEERDIVETERGGYFVVMVRRIEPSRVVALDEAREKAVAAWKQAQRLAALEEMAAGIVGRLGEETSIRDAGEELGVEVRSAGPFTRMDPPASVPPALVDRLFRVKSGEGAFAPVPDATEVVVAQVSSVTMPTPEQIEAESRRFEDMLTSSTRADLGEYFARAVMARHDPQIEWGVVDEVFNRLGGARQGGQSRNPGY